VRRIAAPMIGWKISSSVLTLVVIPVLYLMLLRDKESNLKTCHPICGKSLNRALVRLDDRFRDCKPEASAIVGFLT